jgi:CHAT domain-containing protein
MSFGQINSFRQELEALETENLRRTNGTRDDLLMRAALLEAQARRLGLSQLVGATLLQRGAILNAAACWREAITVVQEARRVLSGSRHVDLLISAFSRLAEAYAGLPAWPEVNAVCEEGIALVEKNRYKVSAPYMQSTFLRFRMILYRLGVRSALELGDVPVLLQRAELAKARGAVRGQLAVGVEEAQETELERRFDEVSRRLEEMTGSLADKDDLQRLREERRSLWDQLAIRRYRRVSAADLPTFQLAVVQQLLAEDEAVIYYFWVNTRELLIVTFDRDRLSTERRSFSATQLQELAGEMNHVINLVGTRQKLPEKFFHKWAWLLPEVDWLAQVDNAGELRKRQLLISPHQLLHAMPFHALFWRNAYLIERFAVTFIPNLTSLLLRYRPPTDRRVLAIGINEYALPGRQIPPLAQAEAEARAVAGLYWSAGVPSTVLCGADACSGRLRRWARQEMLTRFSCIHLAGHAENILGDTPLESHLYLYNAMLDGLELAGWRLPAALVVLSACSAGQRAIGGRGLDEVPGDELFGLQAALFAAGSRWIISPLWPVEDVVGLKLMQTLHRHLASGCTPEVAHQRAVKSFLADAGVKWRRPYYWAQFYVTAMGRPIAGSGNGPA